APPAFLGIGRTAYADDQPPCSRIIRRDATGAEAIHLVGRVREGRFLEPHSASLPCRDASQFRPIQGWRLTFREDEPLPRGEHLPVCRGRLVIPGDGGDTDPSFDES